MTVKRLFTLKGSVISRWRDDVGKDIGGKIYVHRKYMRAVVPAEALLKALDRLSKPDFKTVVYDLREGSLRFDEAPGFDEDREPCAGEWVKVFANGAVKRGVTKAIWHHKWLWVRDDYVGFDVEKSYEWSREWLGRLKEPASGSSVLWQRQLAEVGLI